VSTDPWEEYLAAARRLDAVRRGTTIAAGEQAEVVRVARDELAQVRARLAPQQLRLRALGVPVVELVPSPPEAALGVAAVVGGPDAVLAAVRKARVTVDAVDATLDGATVPGQWSLSRVLLVAVPVVFVLVLLLACVGVAVWLLRS
jgi:hypothetical protein